MTEQDKAMQIQTTLNKTYAYFHAVLSSLLSANFLLFVLFFFFSMTNTGIDTKTDLPADPDLKTSLLMGMIAAEAFVLFLISARAWYKRIKALDKKLATVIVSLIVYTVLLPVLGYLSLVFFTGLMMMI